MNEQTQVTDTPLENAPFAKIDVLHGNLEGLNKSIEELEGAGMLSKADKAQAVLIEARDLMANLIFEAHAIRADFERFKKEGFTNG